jgi:TatA/E family protein of Tat protein translocase
MFGIESKEMLFILLAVLILFGPRRIPEVARALGKGIGDIRDALSGVEREIRDAAGAAPEPSARPAPAAGALPATVRVENPGVPTGSASGETAPGRPDVERPRDSEATPVPAPSSGSAARGPDWGPESDSKLAG